jgi:hypothetical protein
VAASGYQFARTFGLRLKGNNGCPNGKKSFCLCANIGPNIETQIAWADELPEKGDVTIELVSFSPVQGAMDDSGRPVEPGGNGELL